MTGKDNMQDDHKLRQRAGEGNRNGNEKDKECRR